MCPVLSQLFSSDVELTDFRSTHHSLYFQWIFPGCHQLLEENPGDRNNSQHAAYWNGNMRLLTVEDCKSCLFQYLDSLAGDQYKQMI